MPELISETEDLMNLRLAHTGDDVAYLDKTLETLALYVALSYYNTFVSTVHVLA